MNAVQGAHASAVLTGLMCPSGRLQTWHGVCSRLAGDVTVPWTCHAICPRTCNPDSLHACNGQGPSSQQPGWMGTYDTRRPKYLTKPSEGTHNEGFDNDNHDLIVYMDMVIIADAPATRCAFSPCITMQLVHLLVARSHPVHLQP